MKKLLFISLVLCSIASIGQPITVVEPVERNSKLPITISDLHKGESIILKVDSASTEEYGRAFIIIQSSSEPSEELKKWLINVPGQLWKKYQIVPYISIQIGIPGGPPCGPPPRKPC